MQSKKQHLSAREKPEFKITRFFDLRFDTNLCRSKAKVGFLFRVAIRFLLLAASAASSLSECKYHSLPSLSLSLSLSLSFSVFDSWCYKTFLEEILKICISPFAKTTRIGNLKTNEQCLSIDLLKMAKNCFHIFVQVQTSGQTFVNSLILGKSRFTPKNVF